MDDIGRAHPKLKFMIVLRHDVSRAVLSSFCSVAAACRVPFSLEG